MQGEIDEALKLLTVGAAQQLWGSQGPRGQPQGAASRRGRPRSGDVAQLLRLYEHFMLAMARRGEWGVVDHLARHLRSRGLVHSSGTAAALLTSQALQRGMPSARWLLHPDDPHSQHMPQRGQPQAQHHGMAAAPPGSRPLRGVPDHLMDRCLLGRGSAAQYAEDLQGGKRMEGETAAICSCVHVASKACSYMAQTGSDTLLPAFCC